MAGLIRRKYSLSVAESCTGGLIGHRITSVAGSSACFLGGIICYSNDSKIRDLGVAAGLIAREGAVSKWVARSMAEGVKSRFQSMIGLAVTGIAGPGGATKGKPVGTVHIALAHGRGIQARRYQFEGDRDDIKRQSSEAALTLVEQYLKRIG